MKKFFYYSTLGQLFLIVSISLYWFCKSSDTLDFFSGFFLGLSGVFNLIYLLKFGFNRMQVN
ncbi:MAG: hypothetical protein WCK02_13800 [Bacteroidota bacterium]